MIGSLIGGGAGGASGAVAGVGAMAIPGAIIGAKKGAIIGAAISRAVKASMRSSGGGKSGGAGRTERVERAERKASTKQDADRYLDGLQSQRNVLSEKKISTDKREYYEFQQKCQYKGVDFKRGNFISRDGLHHEWEWFRGSDNHRGAIDSITGEVYKAGVPSRKLRVQ